MGRITSRAFLAMGFLAWLCYANLQYDGLDYTLTQPDGSQVPAKLYGDVAAMYAESPDGYSLVWGEDGWLYYARLSEDGELVPGNVIYRGGPAWGVEAKPHLRRHPQKDIQAMEAFHSRNSDYYPERLRTLRKPGAGADTIEDINHYRSFTGEVKGIVLLVDFSDEPASHSVEDIHNFLNQEGYGQYNNNGSVRDLYSYASNGKMDFINDVPTRYFRAPNPKSYYDNGSYSVTRELLEDALDFFDEEIDFSEYDNDGDGTVEALAVMYAGNGQNFGQGIWPHSGGYSGERDGVRFSRYQITDSNPNRLGIYVMAHESGHLIFGWPDAYGTGDQGLMGSRPSDVNPCPPSDVYRADQGWMTIVDVDENTNIIFTDNKNDDVVYRWRNKQRSGEWFLWSNRANEDRYSVLRGSGLQMYHFDFQIRRNSPPATLSLAVVQADGLDELGQENWPSPGSDAGDFFHSGTLDHFDDTSNPPANWNDGNYSGLRLWQISESGDQMTFAVGEDPSPVQGDGLQSDEKFRFALKAGRLHVTATEPSTLHIHLKKMDGSSVIQSVAKVQSGENRYSTDRLTPGIYLLEVREAGSRRIFKVPYLL